MRIIHRWTVRSQQVSRRNAMVASTELTRRRLERVEVEAYLATLAARQEEVRVVATTR